MITTQNDLIDSLQAGDILFPFRRRIWTLFGIVCVIVFLPGSVFILLNGYTALAAGTLCVLATFALNAYCLVRRKASAAAMFLFVAALAFAIGLCVVQRGILGVIWTFPGVLLISFLATGRIARFYAGAFFVCLSAVMLYTIEPTVSVRAVVGLGLTILVTNIFLEMIEKLQKKLVEQSSIDPLTGAFNRREMDGVLRDAIERKRRSATPATLLVLDVDEFKSVNDNHGHAVGDRVLVELAELIRTRMRHMDRLFRLGGEEFMVLLPDTPLRGATVFAEEIRRLMFKAELIADRRITISIGISELADDESAEQWLKRADDAVYQAKDSGRNRIVGGVDDILEVPMIEFQPSRGMQVSVEAVLTS